MGIKPAPPRSVQELLKVVSACHRCQDIWSTELKQKMSFFGTIGDGMLVAKGLCGFFFERGGITSPLMNYILRRGKYGIKQFNPHPPYTDKVQYSVMTSFPNFHKISPKPNK